MIAKLVHGDCRRVMIGRSYDLIIADPPYGVTSLGWDKAVDGWLSVAAEQLKRSGSLWLFGSMRSLMAVGPEIVAAGLRYAQDIVWEKHNGSGFHADRFKRVHEHAVQFYRDDAAWGDVFNEVQTEPRIGRVVVRRPRGMRAIHLSAVDVDPSSYIAEDGSPAIRRSVIYMRSAHGRAIHPTEKPVNLLDILIRTSCPPGGLVGDFFAGSGAVAEACRDAGRDYFGAEIDETYHGAAIKRLQSSLFATPTESEKARSS